MQIDWFTVIAQILNFLILVWLLKRFLYKPILSAIHDREQKIIGQIQDAENKKRDAKKEKELFIEKNKSFDQQEQRRRNESVAALKDERKKRLDQINDEAEVLRAEHTKALQRMQEKVEKEIMQKTQKEVLQISRKTLTDLATVNLEEQIINVFLEKLGSLKSEEIRSFTQAVESGSHQALVVSAFEIPVDLQTKFSSEADKLLGITAQYSFKVSPEIISGVALSLNGYKLSWTVSGYLDELQNGVLETSESIIQQK